MDLDQLIKEAQDRFDENLSRAIFLSNTEAITLAKALLEKYKEVGLTQWRGAIRAPSDEESIRATEKRLGISLPDSMRDFYLSANGIDNVGGELPYSVYGVEDLMTGSESKPKISEDILRVQKQYEQNVGEDIQVMKCESSMDLLRSTFADDHLTTFPVSEADRFLKISSCPGTTVGLCVEALHNIPVGTVMDFEGSTGTFYNNINHWFANALVQ